MMRKAFVVLWLVLLAGFTLADCPIKMASEKLGVFLKSPLDSAGIDVETADSVWIQIWADNGTATRYEARSTTAPFSDIGLDTSLALFAGLTNLKYVYNPLISDIDGTAGNFQLSGAVTLFTKKIPTTTSFCVQVVADSLSKTISLVSAYLNATISSRSTFSASTDSVKPSGTVLASLNNIIKTNSFGVGAIDDNAVADGAIDFGGEFDSAGVSQIIRLVFGDSLATFADSAVLARAVWDNDVVGQSLRTIIVAGMNSGVIDSVDFASTAISFLKTVFLDYVNGTLDASEIGTDAITAVQIAADAVGASEIAADAIGASEIAADAIGASEIALNAIGGSEIADNSIDNGALSASAIGASEIADNAFDSLAFAGDAKKMIAIRADSGSTGSGGGSSDTTAILAMLTNNKFLQMPYDSFTVTAAGASATTQFVTDRLSLTNSGYYTERLLVWSKVGGTAVKMWSSITRFVNNGSSDTLTIGDALPASIAVGDQGRIYALPWPDFATLSEASDSGALAILEADTTGHGADNSVGKTLQTGGAGGGDSTQIKAMLQNNQVLDAADSTLKLAQTSTGAGGLRRGEISSKAEIVDSTKKTPLIIGTNNDKVNYTLSSAGIDAIWDEPKAGHVTAGTYGYYVDAAISGVSGGGSCAGTGSDTTDIFVFAASDSDQFVGVWVNLFVGAERFAVQTDTTGRARFANDASGAYTAIVSARPFTHDNALVTIGTTDTIWMEQSDESPTLTPVCGTLRTLQGQPIMGATVIARNQSTSVRVGNQTVSPYITSVPTDQFGRFTLWLYPTATLGGTSYKYNFTAYRGSTLIESVTSITVPDQATCYEIDWTIN